MSSCFECIVYTQYFKQEVCYSFKKQLIIENS